MNDNTKLRIALRNMEAAGGKNGRAEVDALLIESAKAAATPDDIKRARLLNDIRGVGEARGLEILAAVGRLMGEEEKCSSS